MESDFEQKRTREPDGILGDKAVVLVCIIAALYFTLVFIPAVTGGSP